MAERKEVMTFRKVIPAGHTDVLAQRVKGAGTIERIFVRFYPGQAGTLHVVPFVEHKGQKLEYMLSSVSTGKNYLSGDDDAFEFDVVVPVQNDDFVKVRVTNTGDYDYDLVVDVSIDYYGGSKRIIGGAL